MRIATTIELAEAFGCTISDINNLIGRGFVDAADLQPTSPGQPRIWQEPAAIRLGAALKLHRAGFTAEHAVSTLKSQTALTQPSARWFVIAKPAARVQLTYTAVLDDNETPLLPKLISDWSAESHDPIAVVDLAALRERVEAAISNAAKRWAPPSGVAP